MTRKPIWIVSGALLGIVLVALYVASPWIAAARLTSALKSGDANAIDRMVDFPAVRSSLTSQLTARITAEARSDPETANNPFAGLVTLIAPAIVGQLVNVIVTPDGLAKLSREAQKASAADEARDRAAGRGKGKKNKDEEPKPELGYVGLNEFAATYRSGSNGQMVWTMGRENLFFWKLKKIDLSEIVLDDLTDEAEREPRRRR